MSEHLYNLYIYKAGSRHNPLLPTPVAEKHFEEIFDGARVGYALVDSPSLAAVHIEAGIRLMDGKYDYFVITHKNCEEAERLRTYSKAKKVPAGMKSLRKSRDAFLATPQWNKMVGQHKVAQRAHLMFERMRSIHSDHVDDKHIRRAAQGLCYALSKDGMFPAPIFEECFLLSNKAYAIRRILFLLSPPNSRNDVPEEYEKAIESIEAVEQFAKSNMTDARLETFEPCDVKNFADALLADGLDSFVSARMRGVPVEDLLA